MIISIKLENLLYFFLKKNKYVYNNNALERNYFYPYRMIWIPNRGKRSSQHSNLSFFSFSPNPFWRNFDFHILLDFNLTTESGISESPGDTVMPVCRSRIRVHHKNSTGCAQPVSPAIDFVVESWIRTHSLFNQKLSEILSYWKQEFILHPIFPYRQFDLLTHIFHHPNQISFTFYIQYGFDSLVIQSVKISW